jgi:hypothetical protein
VEATLRSLNATDQRRVALVIAELALPFGDLADLAERPLRLIAQDLRESQDPAQIDRLRRQLWDSPALHVAEEPADTRTWFAYGAVIAWIYAADALCTSPSDGLINTYVRLLDLLDAAEDDLTIPGLCDRFAVAVSDVLAGTGRSVAAVLTEIEGAAQRIARRP